MFEKIMSRYLPIVAVVALLTVPCLVFKEQTYHGLVLDAETNEPIEGVIVDIEYYIAKIGCPGYEPSHHLADVRETITDKTGRFSLPKRFIFAAPNTGKDMTIFLIYKPGYVPFPGHPTATPIPNLTDMEVFLNEEIGSDKVLEAYHEDIRAYKRATMKMGIIHLAKLKTKEERKKVNVSPSSDESFWEKQPLLIKALREEHQYLFGGAYPKDLYDFNIVSQTKKNLFKRR